MSTANFLTPSIFLPHSENIPSAEVAFISFMERLLRSSASPASKWKKWPGCRWWETRGSRFDPFRNREIDSSDSVFLQFQRGRTLPGDRLKIFNLTELIQTFSIYEGYNKSIFHTKPCYQLVSFLLSIFIV